jgi:hypothetical protein
MAAVRIIDNVADLVDTFKGSVQRLLKHGSHGGVMAGIHLISHLIESHPSVLPQWEI